MRRVLEWLTRRLPCRVVRDKSNNSIYLVRYYVFRSAPIELALHHILRSDGDPRLHNHPWQWAASLILIGGYVEERLGDDMLIVARHFRAGNVNAIDRSTFHRVSELLSKDAWTLFLHGRRKNDWHFRDSPMEDERRQ